MLRSPASLWWLVLAGCSACGPVARYQAMRNSCGLGDGEHVPAPFGATGTYFEISTSCSTALGKAVGLDWGSFGTSPHEVAAPADLSDALVGGLFVPLGAELGGLEELPDDITPRGAVAQALDSWNRRHYSADEQPAGVFWTDFVSSAIVDIARRTDSGSEDLMTYALGSVRVSDAFGSPTDATANPVFVGAAIIHEAAHSVSPGHVSCTDGTGEHCDADETGAWGAEIDFLNVWIWHSGSDASDEDLAVADSAIAAACGCIMDISGIPVCMRSSALYCGSGL